MKNYDIFNFKIEEPFLLRQMIVFPLSNGGTSFENIKPLRNTDDSVKIIETENIDNAVVDNRALYDVFMIDGEEIYGGLQNRVVDTTALIGSEQSIEVPVSCVEEGRWEGNEVQFDPGYISFPSIRAVITDSVNNSLAESGIFKTDQKKIWKTVSKKLTTLKVQSMTSSMHDIFSSFDDELNHIVDDIKIGDFNGFLVGINGKVGWMDFFGDKKLFQYYFKPLLKSYLVESMGKKGGRFISASTANKFIEELKKMPLKIYDGIDKGKELRFKDADKSIKGKALVLGEVPLHISVFS